MKTWWTIEDSEKAAIAKVLGPNALNSDEVYIEKDYADKRTWSVNTNEEAVVKYLIESSDLSNEEKTALGTPKDVEELKGKLVALPDSSPRGAALAAHIDATIPQGRSMAGRAPHA